MAITITFADGTAIRGQNAREVFEAWRSDPWNADCSHDEFREVVVKRAYVLSGAIIDHGLPLDELLGELAGARVIGIERAGCSRDT